MKVRFTPEARADLREIFSHYRHIDRRLALRMIDRIERRCRRLSRFPEANQRFDEKLGDLRRLVVAPHVVAYRVRGGAVEIIRVLYGARDIERLLQGSEPPTREPGS